MDDKLWENLYWTPELTRPDRFAKILNTIIRKESGEFHSQVNVFVNE
jgi:hypothetical protein